MRRVARVVLHDAARSRTACVRLAARSASVSDARVERVAGLGGLVADLVDEQPAGPVSVVGCPGAG